MTQRSKKETEAYGDWQTSLDFAISVCSLLKQKGLNPTAVFEPTCGKGHFIQAALTVFPNIKKVFAVEIHPPYVEEAETYLAGHAATRKDFQYAVYLDNIFQFDFNRIKQNLHNDALLILGNPPWVTNSQLSKIDGPKSLPPKTNYKNAKGIDAITGKGNFDIAESICNLMFSQFSDYKESVMAFLVKNAVIKNLITHQGYEAGAKVGAFEQYIFDAKKEFNVSVAAALLLCKINHRKQSSCIAYDFYSKRQIARFGWTNNKFVSNIETYARYAGIDSLSPLVWRSGIKHDCSKVMELSLENGRYVNGLSETVSIENELIYPLLKSSDIGNGFHGQIRKYVLLPQKNITDNTDHLAQTNPKAYSYLSAHAHLLDARKSIIYKNKPRFCIFGLGDYSFSKHKIVISSLYKSAPFSLISEIDGKPAMVDDTCYMLGFNNLQFARITLSILRSPIVRSFIESISFADAKRIVNRELLMRIDLLKASGLVDLNAFSPEDIAAYRAYLRTHQQPEQASLFNI